DVMTDKATVQVPSPVQGKVQALGGKVGEVMAVGTELIRLEVEGPGNVAAGAKRGRGPRHAAADQSGQPPDPHTSTAKAESQDDLSLAPGRQPGATGETVAERQPLSVSAGNQPAASVRVEPAPSGGGGMIAARPDGGKPLASPAVRKRAWDLGIELQYVPGSGPAGQITHADLDGY